MNFKTFLIIAIMVFSIIVSSCDKEDETTNTPEPTVIFFTDNTSYVDLDNIVFTIKNETPDTVKYGACAFSDVLDIEIQKKTDSAWVTTNSTLCLDYMWANLAANSQISDTISADMLEQGDYRIKSKLIVGSNNTVLYSGEFNKR